MAEGSHCTRFFLEAQPGLFVNKRWGKHLNCILVADSDMNCPQNDAHAAPADPIENAIVAANYVADSKAIFGSGREFVLIVKGQFLALSSCSSICFDSGRTLTAQMLKQVGGNGAGSLTAYLLFETFGADIGLPAGELKTQETMGEVVELAAGGLVVLLSGLALYQQSGVGNRRYIQPKPNMLARVLKCQHDPNSDFPEIVWRFLNSPTTDPQNGNKTRIDLLIQKWQRYKFIGSMNDSRSQPRLAALCNTHPSGRVNLSLLQDRIDLLSDLKAAIFQMDRALLDLLQNLAVD